MSWVFLKIVFLTRLVYSLPESLPNIPQSQVVYETSCNSTEGINRGCSEDCMGIQLCLSDTLITLDCATQTSNTLPYCDHISVECIATPNRCFPNKFTCPIQDGYYPHPLDCTQFYTCHEGSAYLSQCDNTNYVAKPPGCKKTTACYNFSPTNGLCRNKLDTFVVHPLDKSIYIYCQIFPVVNKCPGENVIFDIKLENCRYDCKVKGSFPDTSNEEWYYVCKKDGLKLISEHLRCQDGYIFDAQMATCIISFPQIWYHF